jgi:hypothetical protein
MMIDEARRNRPTTTTREAKEKGLFVGKAEA